MAWIRALTGQARVPFCYPWGGPGTYTADTVGILARPAIRWRSTPCAGASTSARDDRYELPRFDTRDLPPYTRGEPAAVPAPRGVDEA